MPPLPRGAVRQPTPADYGGRPGKELWAILRRRYKVERALSKVNADLNKLFGKNVETEEDELQLASPAEKVLDQLQKKRLFVGPENRVRQIWDGMQVFLLFYVAFIIPFRECYDVQVTPWTGEFWWEVFVDCYFILDIFLNFRTAIVDKHGALVLSSKKIAQAYMTSTFTCCSSPGPGWFWLDLVACLPVSYIELAVNGGKSPQGAGGQIKAFKILRLLRLAKMLRVARLKRILQRYEEQFAVMHKIMIFMKLLGMMLAIMYTTHVLCCLWYVVGFTEMTNLDGELIPENVGWLEREGFIVVERSAACQHRTSRVVIEKNLFAQAHTEETCHAAGQLWITDTETPVSTTEMVDMWTQYLTSFYWSITTLTTVGYGDISAVTNSEKVMSVFAELLGGMIFGMLVGTLSSIITQGRMAEQIYNDRMEQVGEFMRVKNVPIVLRRRVRVFYENLFKQKSVFDENEFLTQLSPQLAKELTQFMYEDIMGHVPLFNGLPDSIVTKMCLSLRPFTATEGDEITREKEEGSELYIITKGEVKLSRDGIVIGLMTSGSFFGEEAVVDYFMKGRPADLVSMRSESATAKTEVNMVFLTREDASDFMVRYRTFKNNMLQSYTRRHARSMRRLQRLEELNAEATAGAVVVGKLGRIHHKHEAEKAAAAKAAAAGSGSGNGSRQLAALSETPKTRSRRVSLNSQVINHLAGETKAEAEAKASGIEVHELEQIPSGLPGSPKAAGAAAGAQASPEIMRAVWQLDARQERVEQSVNGLIALMSGVNQRLVAIDEELQSQRDAEARSASPAPAQMISPPPPGSVVAFSDQAQP